MTPVTQSLPERLSVAERTPDESSPAKARHIGLSGKLLLLTVVFVMLAEILIYVPSIANFRKNYLRDRWAAARVATMVLQAAPDGMVPRELELKLLAEVGANTVALKTGENRYLFSAVDKPPVPQRDIDLQQTSSVRLMVDALATLASDGEGSVRVTGQVQNAQDMVELVFPERPLQAAMWQFSANILFLSLVISGFTALLVYLALQWLIVRPVHRLSDNITAFAADPEDAARIITPSGRSDEIGAAEQAIAGMQDTLSRELRNKKHLAALGLAVSKINHDLRNMLATAQLMSDRLVQSNDPLAQRFAPRLIATLDRAIAFCQSTLAYGRAMERDPQRETFAVAELVQEAIDAVMPEPVEGLVVTADVSPGLKLNADREQMFRALSNLVRNAVQALTANAGDAAGRVEIAASRSHGTVIISIADNGPGLPEKSRAHLFEAFSGSARAGGTGLGLAIVAELVRLNRGQIILVDSARGAHFRITVQDA
ncbi:MAG: sensor histidine kinase [Beijerinckiaceae bacterium]